MSSRLRVMQLFLWLAVLGWGVGLGAKLFDLLVVAGAWSATPPSSFVLLPYGSRYPLNPGDFFQPLSAVMAVGVLGALISGWRSSSALRFWLWFGVIAFGLIWAITPTVFWPMINQLYGISTGKIVASGDSAVQLARRWLAWDWCRVALIAAGFVATVRALCLAAVARDAAAAQA
jgi:hypothetical protein